LAHEFTGKVKNPMDNRFKVVGYLIPSNAQRSFKVIIEGKFYGLVAKEAMLRGLRTTPFSNIEVSRFINSPSSKITEQQPLIKPMDTPLSFTVRL
jgi:hypothetical protein